MAAFFYAFADEAAAVAADALEPVEVPAPPMTEGAPGATTELRPTQPGAMILRRDGIALTPAEIDPETRAIITPATLSAPLVILSPTMMPGCSSALVVPCDHVGFA